MLAGSARSGTPRRGGLVVTRLGYYCPRRQHGRAPACQLSTPVGQLGAQVAPALAGPRRWCTSPRGLTTTGQSQALLAGSLGRPRHGQQWPGAHVGPVGVLVVLRCNTSVGGRCSVGTTWTRCIGVLLLPWGAALLAPARTGTEQERDGAASPEGPPRPSSNDSQVIHHGQGLLPQPSAAFCCYQRWGLSSLLPKFPVEAHLVESTGQSPSFSLLLILSTKSDCQPQFCKLC